MMRSIKINFILFMILLIVNICMGYSSSIKLEAFSPITEQDFNVQKSPKTITLDGRFLLLYLDSSLILDNSYHLFNDLAKANNFLNQPINSNNGFNLYLVKMYNSFDIGVVASYNSISSTNFLRDVKFYSVPIRKSNVLYGGVNLYSKNKGSFAKIYYFNELYKSELDSIYIASLYSQYSFNRSLIKSFGVNFNLLYRPLLGNIALNDTLKNEYLAMDLSLFRKNNFIKNFNLELRGSYIDGANFEPYFLFKPSSSLLFKFGNFNFFRLAWQQDLSVVKGYIIKQYFDFQLYKNFYNQNLHNYGYNIKFSLIDKFAELSYSFRVMFSYWIGKMFYIKPEVFGIYQADLEQFTTRDCLEIGTYVGDIKIYIAPYFDGIIPTIDREESEETINSNLTLKVGVSYND